MWLGVSGGTRNSSVELPGVCGDATRHIEVLINSIEPYTEPLLPDDAGITAASDVCPTASAIVDTISAIAVESGRSMAYIGQ